MASRLARTAYKGALDEDALDEDALDEGEAGGHADLGLVAVVEHL